MKRSFLLLLTLVVVLAVSIGGFAQDQPSQAKGRIVAPPSTLGRVPGIAVRTPLFIFIPDEVLPANSYPLNAETAGSIACIYGVTPLTTGCPKNGSPLATGGAKAIAVVDYGVNASLQSDMDTFNAHFGLPNITITKICSCASCPNNAGSGWDVETALDVEWAHAMAPNAQIILSSFCSDPFTEIPGAETLAGQAVAAAGGGEVSNSFGYGGESSGETSWDQYMQIPSVVYFTSAGDSGLGADYPSVSPYTVSAGGTHIVRDGSGNFNGVENCWSGSGGGVSQYEALPLYQNIVRNFASAHRVTPDMSADADPNSGVGVYSTTGCGGWCQVGGTSVSSPVLAGITNAAGSFLNSTNGELTKTYGEFKNPGIYHQLFFDVVTGSNGAPAKFGYDECTGIGSPRKQAGL
jgi:kumamolisin